ncbi:hypothetical protein MBAV_005365, partial [Candidatus Magnetobacterium bavaricum]
MLYYGKKISNTLKGEEIKFIFFISDEIFAGSMPILITIEPKSTAILRIEIAENRKSESWKNHWVEIEKNYFYTLGLVSDRGKGLCEGFKEHYPDKSYQPDIFHEFRELTKIILVTLNRVANNAIKNETKRAKVISSARSKAVIDKRTSAYKKASKESDDAMEAYDIHCYLLKCIM